MFRFRTSPIEIKGDEQVESIVLGRNELVDENGRIVAKDTGEREEVPAQLVVRAVGYRGVPAPGLPFDERSGTIPHTAGRIEGSRNEYVVGWIKRGPTGVIGSNKSDSQETVDTLIEDLSGAELADVGADHGEHWSEWLLERQPKVVTDDHWKLINEHERSAGRAARPAAGEADQRRRAAAHRPRLTMFERFTVSARRAVVISQSEARALKDDHVRPVHLLLGVMTAEDASAAAVLAAVGVEPEAVRNQIAATQGAWQGRTVGSHPVL